MLLRGSNTRGARGSNAGRSRGSRGRGSTSRGASSSSSKYKSYSLIPNSSRSFQGSPKTFRNRFFVKELKHKYSSSSYVGPIPTSNAPNLFEQERLENAAKREQRGQNGAMVNGRGGRGAPRGLHNNKQVRFADPPATGQKLDTFNTPSSVSTTNPFGNPNVASSPFGATGLIKPFNPFASPAKTDTLASSASGLNPATNPFALTSQATTASSMGIASGTSKDNEAPNLSNNFFTKALGAPSNPNLSNPFGTRPAATNGTLGTSSERQDLPSQSSASIFGSPSGSSFPGFSATSLGTASKSTFGSPGVLPKTSSISSTISQQTINEVASASASSSQAMSNFKPGSSSISASSRILAQKMDQLLRKEGIIAPPWPTSHPGDPNQKSALEAFWQTSKGYRSKVRASLIKAGLLDDPDKPKKLSEAIDFKGTCEDMCPEFEKITRIVEHDVQSAEKEVAPDGSLWPSPRKMIKALARSAAGQDAPLPMDVRSPAALRRTLDYLLHTILGNEGDLPAIHGFLWDRTRAIRRDFVFQSSMSSSELSDQVDCLERITRFHVIALHQMSREGVVAEDFSEQQEVEQLGKALLSLIHAYEDCKVQGISCHNEPEFRAYYVLFNGHNSGILETVQDWEWKFWGESDQIRIAINLVETLQNNWDMRGPLKPQAATDVAQNAYSRFFSIIEGKTVSYTMACFAETHFNSVRKSVLNTILTSYRKQRDQTKDWTLTRLNTYLRFDNEADIVAFGEAYGLRFDNIDGEDYLSFESEDGISDPFPPLKQPHSYSLVERKRGSYSLPEVIESTVYEEGNVGRGSDEADDDNGLFVKDNKQRFDSVKNPLFNPIPKAIPRDDEDDTLRSQDVASISAIKGFTRGQPELPNSISIFDQETTPQTFDGDFSTSKLVDIVSPVRPSGLVSGTPSIFAKEPVSQNSPIFDQKPVNNAAPSIFAPFMSSSPEALLQAPVESAKTPNVVQQREYVVAPNDFRQSPFVSNPISAATVGPAKTGNLNDSHVKSMNQLPLPQPFLGVLPTAAPIHVPPPINPPPIDSENTKTVPAEQPTLEDKIFHTKNIFSDVKAPATPDRLSQLERFANWIALGEDGLIDQFTIFTVERLLRETATVFVKEEAARIAKEKDDLSRKEADEFRYRSLATKYCHLWRENAHRTWLRRRGREARQARREMAESLRASKATQLANVVEDFKASTGSHRRSSLESLLDATGILNGVHDLNAQIQAIANHDTTESAKKMQRSERGSDSSSSENGTHKSRKSNPLRRSLLSDPSYLNGGSRIHLMSTYGARDEDRRHVSGVQTDYFRLKARGITTLPDGTPLATSVANNILHQKHSLGGISKLTTQEESKEFLTARNAPTMTPLKYDVPRTNADRNEDIQALKSRAKALMSQDMKSYQKNQKRNFEDDEELFERAKRIREQMDEGAKWFRREIERDTTSRSVS